VVEPQLAGVIDSQESLADDRPEAWAMNTVAATT